MMGYIDTMRAEGHAAWPTCRVLREQDHQIAARTYWAWKRGAVRTVTDAQVRSAILRSRGALSLTLAAWSVEPSPPKVSLGVAR